jgi:hypothetical protein
MYDKQIRQLLTLWAVIPDVNNLRSSVSTLLTVLYGQSQQIQESGLRSMRDFLRTSTVYFALLTAFESVFSGVL